LGWEISNDLKNDRGKGKTTQLVAKNKEEGRRTQN
jgi:hypothetical protein